MKRQRRTRGFTLIELLVVLFMLRLLGSIVGPRVMGYVIKARSDSAGLQVQDVAATMDLCKLEIGRYPATDQGPNALVEAPANAPSWRPLSKKEAGPQGPVGE